MREKLKISIITVCYNSQKYIENTIKSVLKQTYSNIEYIIIDGNSIDRTMEIVKNYKKQIDKVISEPDEGIYDAFNKGIVNATGDIVYFLNSDDTLYKEDIIEIIMEEFENYTNSIVYGNVLLNDEHNHFPMIYGKEISIEDFKKGYAPPHQAVFVHKELFEKYGMFDTQHKIIGDYERSAYFFLKEQGRIQYVNEIIASFRVGGVSSNYQSRIIGLKEKEEVVSQLFDIDVDFTKTEIVNNALYRKWLESILLNNQGITAQLKAKNIKNVVVFGAMTTGLYLIEDLQKENFNILGVIDNNKNIQNENIEREINIFPESWLIQNQDHVDAVLVSIESNQDDEIIQRLKKDLTEKVYICSWKELVR